MKFETKRDSGVPDSLVPPGSHVNFMNSTLSSKSSVPCSDFLKKLKTKLVNVSRESTPSKPKVCELAGLFQSSRTSTIHVNDAWKLHQQQKYRTKCWNILSDREFGRTSRHFIIHKKKYEKWYFWFKNAVCTKVAKISNNVRKSYSNANLSVNNGKG